MVPSILTRPATGTLNLSWKPMTRRLAHKCRTKSRNKLVMRLIDVGMACAPHRLVQIDHTPSLRQISRCRRGVVLQVFALLSQRACTTHRRIRPRPLDPLTSLCLAPGLAPVSSNVHESYHQGSVKAVHALEQRQQPLKRAILTCRSSLRPRLIGVAFVCGVAAHIRVGVIDALLA